MEELLNEDLTTWEHVNPFLKQCVGKGKEIPAASLLQVQQVTNLSFPSYDKPFYDADKHTLKVTVTDGVSQAFALVSDGCPGLNLNTPPGTKVKTTQAIPVQGSLFVLNRNNCEVIGGRVPKLFEKWEIQKKMAIKHEWGYTGTSIEGEGPPPWKPFGYKPSIDVAAIRKMKTIDVVSEKEGKGGEAKTQFDMLRDEAISELQGTANKQKFQKPNKHLLDKEITDIMEEGFSQTDAEYAMNRFKNTQKAIKFLKDSKKRQDGLPREPPKTLPERKDRRKGKGRGDEDEEQEVPAEFQRPTKSISLFGFIENQIKTEEKPVLKLNGPRTHDLEDSMARLSTKDSYSHSGRNDRGGGGRARGNDVRSDRGGGGYRGSRGGGGGGGRSSNYGRKQNDYYQSNDQPPQQQQQRYESKRFEEKGSRIDGDHQRPPRFLGQSGGDGGRFSSDYNSSNSRGHTSNSSRGGDYDNSYGRGQGHPRGSYESRSSSSSYHHENTSSSSHRNQGYQDYSSNYQTQQQQQQQQRPQTGKSMRPYSSSDYPPPGGDHYHQQPQQQQYQRSNNDYPPVPSQSYQQYQQPQKPPPARQYMNSGSGGGSHDMSSRPPPPSSSTHYSNHSGGGGSGKHSNSGGGPPPHPSEFNKYQYGYEDWNPARSLVFTRSKPDGGRGGSSARGNSASSGAGPGYQNSGAGGRGGGASYSHSYNNRTGRY